MKNGQYPSISVVMATYNSERTIRRSLESIRAQNYPQEKIEIIVVDGASQDNTVNIAEEYNVILVKVDSLKQNAEYNKSLGIQKAKNEILAMIDHDNILPHNEWLKRMVKPFIERIEVVGTETLRYQYDSNTTLLDRYFALFGAGDPLVWYLGKADRLSYICDRYPPSRNTEDCGDYYIVQFTIDTMPTIGANGFLVRREILLKYAKASPGMYFDMDVNVDLIAKGFRKYAFVKDSILHLTGYGSIRYFLKRRLLFISQYNRGKSVGKEKQIRRYGILSKKDIILLGVAIIVCATIIIPFIDSFRGYRKIHDIAWFLHPILCFSFVIIYSWVIIKGQTYVYAKKFLGR